MSIERRRRDPNAAKPLGPIPQGFEAIDGELAIGGRKASDLVAEAGDTPLFVYSRAMLDTRMAALRVAMPESLAIHYAVKANPHVAVIRGCCTLRWRASFTILCKSSKWWRHNGGRGKQP